MDLVENYFCRFLARHAGADVVEVSVDEDPQATPFLSLGAFEVNPGSNLDRALQEADDEEDMGLLYQALNSVGSFSLEHEITRLYPQWPSDVKLGDVALRAKLRSVLETYPAGMAPHTHVFFHHADQFPLWDLREPEPHD